MSSPFLASPAVLILLGGMALAQGATQTGDTKPATQKAVVAVLDDVQAPKPPATTKPATSTKSKKNRPAAKPAPAPEAPADPAPPEPPVVPPPSGHAATDKPASTEPSDPTHPSEPSDPKSDEAKAKEKEEADAKAKTAAETDAKTEAEIAAAEAEAKAKVRAKIEAAAAKAAADAEAEAAKAAAEKAGMSVRVENLQTPKGEIDPQQVKLSAPFAPKPFAPPPAGWKLETSNKVPTIKRMVEISPGVRIKLDVQPHLLLPASDATEAMGVNEPGFDPAQGYHQTTTIGAILSQSLTQLERDSIAMSDAIDRLQQVLVALPSDPTPEPEVTEPTAPAAVDPIVESLRTSPSRKPTSPRR